VCTLSYKLIRDHVSQEADSKATVREKKKEKEGEGE